MRLPTNTTTRSTALHQAGAALLLLLTGAVLQPAMAQLYCDPGDPFSDYNDPNCCPPYDYSCPPDPYDPGPSGGGGGGGGGSPPDPLLCQQLDAVRRNHGCMNDPGPNGFDFNQELSPLEFRKAGERLALGLMSSRLPSARLPGIFTRHTACYGALGASKIPCDGTFVKALLAECKQLPVMNPVNAIIPGEQIYPRAECILAVNALSFTMAPGVRGYVIPLLASIDIPFVSATDLASGFLDWHQSKWKSVNNAIQCNIDYANLRSKDCIP